MKVEKVEDGGKKRLGKKTKEGGKKIKESEKMCSDVHESLKSHVPILISRPQTNKWA